MSQTYRATPPDSTTNILQDNIDQINNDEALRSFFSGTAFPTSPEPVIGQPCYRTDEKVWYIYTADGWVEASQIGAIPNEVKVARGTQANLDARLSVSLNDDGSLKSPTTANVSEWKETGLAVTRVDSGTFKVNTDQTGLFTTNRQIKANGDSGYEIMYVTGSSYNDTTDETTVSVSGVLPDPLNSVDYGLIQYSVPQNYLISEHFSAKGDLLVGTGEKAKTALPVGADGEVLMADSGKAEGVRWTPGTKQMTDAVTVTVGSGGQFTTINAAIAHLVQTYYPIYLSSGTVPQATINLLPGFVMAEQVLVEGLDLSWITITGVDAETMITRSALTRSLTSRYPAFGAWRGTLPVIGQLFNMDASGVADNRDGVYCNFGRCQINPGCGVKNAGTRGIFAINGSTINAYGADASGAGNEGIIATSGGIVNANGANASGAGIYGIVAYSGGIVNANGADASGAGTNGIVAYSGGIINANGATGTLNQTANTVTLNGIIFQ